MICVLTPEIVVMTMSAGLSEPPGLESCWVDPGSCTTFFGIPVDEDGGPLVGDGLEGFKGLEFGEPGLRVGFDGLFAVGVD